VKHQGEAKSCRNGISCGVVHRGAQPAGGDQDIGALRCFSNQRCDTVFIVSHSGNAVKVIARFFQVLGDETRIGILDISKQQFGSDIDDLYNWHNTLFA
jgi:hypothetical protein